MDHLPSRQPVDRRLLLQTDLLTVRDNVCSRDDPSLSAETPPLPYHELSIPLAGVWVLRDGPRAAPFVPGSAHLLTQGFTYRAEHPCGCGVDRNLGVSFRDDLRDELGVEYGGALRSRRSLNARHVATAWALLSALRSAASDTMRAEEATLALMTCLSPSHTMAEGRRTTSETSRAHDMLALRVEEVLASRYPEPLSLAIVARSVHSSPFHMSRVFRARTGRSIGERLRAVRLAAAIESLVETHDALECIATRVGFADAPHLARAFRSALGTTPGQFRTQASGQLLRSVNALLNATARN